MRVVVFCALVLMSWFAQANQPEAARLVLDHAQRYALNPHLEYLKDPAGKLTLQDVGSAAYRNKFQSLKQHGNQGVTRSVIWLRTTVNFSGSPHKQWLLQFDYCPIEDITLFLRFPDGTVRTAQSGNFVPPAERPYQDKHFVFPIDITRATGGEYLSAEVFLRIETSGPVIISTQLVTPKEKASALKVENRIMGLVYGMLLAMLLYNLFLYLSIRESNYLSYVAYIAAATWTLSSHDGSFQELFAPLSLWFSHNSIYFSVCLCALFAAWFMRDFLELALHAPLLDRILQSLQLISVALLPMVFLVDNFTLTYIATLLMAVVGACALSAGIICTRMESRTGKYFLLAWSTLILGIFLSCLRYLGLAPESSLTQYFVHVGVLAEVLLLSFALADRINRMRQEKAAFQEQANALLQETNLKLEKSMLLQRNFLTAASHELRTPMNGIMGATDLLSDCDSEEERNQYINDIYRSSRKMMSLVENILDFTDVESGDFRPINKAFTLSELLEPLIIQFKGKAHRKGLNFSFELDPADPQLLCRVYEADPRIIQKAMSQLLSNALKFTSRGEISVITRINKNILYPEKTKLAIEIKDTGIGMKPETLKDMFIAFQQGDGTFKRQYEGLGIGLSLAKSLMDKVEGTLSAKSSAGQGSSFTLSLKIRDTGNTREAANEELPQALITRPKPVPARNKQILLVEDNPVNLKVLNKMVEKQGYSTLIAENGMQAVQLLQDYKVDLVLMDCQMPVMDGFEATREIRQMHNGNQHVPIVAVTANTLSEDEAQCYDAGMNGFVPKPINQKVIQSLLLKWLNQPYLAVDQTQAKKVDYLPAKHS